MAQERKNSVSAANKGGCGNGAPRDMVTVIEKKIRNLEKRRGRLELAEQELGMGKELSENQLAALEKKEQVMDMLSMCRYFLATAETLSKAAEAAAKTRARKELRDAHTRTVETIGKVLRFQFLLGEGLHQEHLDDNAKVLETLRSLVDEAQQKDFGKAAEIWMNVIEAKTKEFAPGMTFELAHEKLSALSDLTTKLNGAPDLSATSEEANSTQRATVVVDSTINSTVRPVSPSSITDRQTSPTSDLNFPESSANCNSASDTALNSNPDVPRSNHIDTIMCSDEDQQFHPSQGRAGETPEAHALPVVLNDQNQSESAHQEISSHSQEQAGLQEHSLAPQPVVNHTNTAHHSVHHHSVPPHPSHHPASHAISQPHTHPGQNIVAVVCPGVGVISMSPSVPTQPQQQLDVSDDGDPPIQFGSVERTVAASSHVAAPVVTASASPSAGPDFDAMFEDREFDFLQDDMLASAAPSIAASMAVTAAPTVLPSPLHADPAVVHVQTTPVDSGGPLNPHYQQILQLQHNIRQSQSLQQQIVNVHSSSQQPHQIQQIQACPQNTTSHDSDSVKSTELNSSALESNSSNTTGITHTTRHHQGQHGLPPRHERENRKSPRDYQRSGDHEGPQHYHKGGSNGYYRNMNGGGHGHRSGYGGESNGRNWDNRGGHRGNSWNNRGERYGGSNGNGGYNSGLRHGNYGNRNSGGMVRREQPVQKS